MARYKGSRKTRRSSARRTVRRNSDVPIEPSSFFTDLLAKRTPEIEKVTQKVEAKRKKAEEQAASLRTQARNVQTGEARAKREVRERAQISAGRPRPSFLVEEDPVRMADDAVEVKGNVIEGVAYVVTLPSTRQQIWSYVSLDDLRGRNKMKIKTSAVTTGFGMERRELEQDILADYSPAIDDEQAYAARLRRLVEARGGRDLVATEADRREVEDEMIAERLSALLGAEHEKSLDVPMFLRLAARKKSGGYTDINLYLRNKSRTAAYIVKIDGQDRTFEEPFGTGKFLRVRNELNRKMTEYAYALGMVGTKKAKGKYTVRIVTPTSQRVRDMGRQRIKTYPGAQYDLADDTIRSNGPLYLRIQPKIGPSFIVTMRYRQPMRRRGDLMALYGRDDPRSRNPYYSFVSGGFRQSYDPSAYVQVDPDEGVHLDASRVTMKQFAAVRDATKTIGSFTRTVNRIRGLLTDWGSPAARGRSRRAMNDDVVMFSCLMTLNTVGVDEKRTGTSLEVLLRTVREQQKKVVSTIPTLMQNYVGLFFLLRNILLESNIKASKMRPARDFFAFSEENAVFAPFHADLMDMKKHVQALLGQADDQEFDFDAIARLPALSPMQDMLLSVYEQQKIDDAIEQAINLLNATPASETERRAKINKVLQDLESGRRAMRDNRKKQRDARLKMEEAARMKIAADTRIGEMSAYQYRRHLADQSTEEILVTFAGLLQSAPAEEDMKPTIAKAMAVMGLTTLPREVIKDKILCFLLLYSINNESTFISALSSVGGIFTYYLKGDDPARIVKWQSGADKELRNLEASYRQYIRQRVGAGGTEVAYGDLPQEMRDEAIRILMSALDVDIIPVKQQTSAGVKKTVYVSRSARRFADLLTYFDETESCLDNMYRRKDQRKSVLLRVSHDVHMLGLILFGVSMDLFTPAVSNYLAPVLPEAADNKSFRFARPGDQYFAMAEETEQAIIKKLKLPNYREMGQQMKSQYGQEVYYTYNPVLFAYARQRGGMLYALPSSLSEISQGFGAYGNYIKLVREIVNRLALEQEAITKENIATVFNAFVDDYQFPGVPALPKEGQTAAFDGLNTKLKKEAYQAISLAGRMAAVPPGVEIASGISTYGVGLGIEGGRLKADISSIQQAAIKQKKGDAKNAFLGAVARYAQALLPIKVYDVAISPEKFAEAQERIKKRAEAVAKYEESLQALPAAQRLIQRRKGRAALQQARRSSIEYLPPKLADALTKWVRDYLKAGRNVKAREDLGADFTKYLEWAIAGARSESKITGWDLTYYTQVLDGLAYLYMRTVVFEQLQPLSVGAARMPTDAGPAMQAAGARYAQYAEALRRANQAIFKF